MFGIQPVTVVSIAGAMTFGMVLGLFARFKLALARRQELDQGRVGTLIVLLNLLLIPMMIVSGVLMDFGGPTPTLIAGSLATALAIFSLGLQPAGPGSFAALLVAGLGSAALNIGSVVLMPRGFFGAAQMTASLNLGNVFVALGALISAPLTTLLLRRLEWRRTLALLSVFCLIPALLAALFHSALAEFQVTPTPLPDLLETRVVWLAGMVFCLYAPLEGAISTWAAGLLADDGQRGGRRGAWVLAAFWIAFLASRFLTAIAQHGGLLSESWDATLVVVPPLLVAAVLGNLAGAAERASAWRGALMLGLLLGPVYPTLVSILFRQLGTEHIETFGTAYALMFALGSLGSLALAPLIGIAARKRTLNWILITAMLVALGVSAAALVLCLLTAEVRFGSG